MAVTLGEKVCEMHTCIMIIDHVMIMYLVFAGRVFVASALWIDHCPWASQVPGVLKGACCADAVLWFRYSSSFKYGARFVHRFAYIIPIFAIQI